MKKYETPVAEITTFAVEDVVTTSSQGGSQDCTTDLGEF